MTDEVLMEPWEKITRETEDQETLHCPHVLVFSGFVYTSSIVYYDPQMGAT